MSADTASLLTKTQRRRIANGFDDLDDDARSRDERRIRERFAAGLHDLSRLRDYPDEQLALAVEDFDEGRYHRQSETVLFRRGTVLVTVYDARDVTADLRATINACREATA